MAKGVASGTISRGRALKTLAGTALAVLFGGSIAVEEAEAKTDRVCRNKTAVSNRSCPDVDSSRCRRTGCSCFRTTGGDKRCVEVNPIGCPPTDECDRNRDCAQGEVCVQYAGCCEGVRNNR